MCRNRCTVPKKQIKPMFGRFWGPGLYSGCGDSKSLEIFVLLVFLVQYNDFRIFVLLLLLLLVFSYVFAHLAQKHWFPAHLLVFWCPGPQTHWFSYVRIGFCSLGTQTHWSELVIISFPMCRVLKQCCSLLTFGCVRSPDLKH